MLVFLGSHKIFRLQLQFFPRCCVGTKYCNVTPLSYRILSFQNIICNNFVSNSGRKKAHKHKLFALVNVQMALGQTAGCPRVNRVKKFMCSPRNIGNINFSLWSIGGLSQGCPDFQKVYVFKVYVPFSCPTNGNRLALSGAKFQAPDFEMSEPENMQCHSAVKQRGRENGYCPKIILLKRAKMVLCPFHRSHREICTRNRPLSKTKFLDDFWGPFLSRPLCFTAGP